MDLKSTPFLEIPLLQPEIVRENGKDGIIYFKSKTYLEPYPTRITDRLVTWAKLKPNDPFLAQKNEHCEWIKLTYRDALLKAEALGQYFLNQKVSLDKPIAILSGNSIEMGIVKLAAMHIGIPFCPISVAYSTKSTDFEKLKYCIDLLTPGLIFVQDGDLFKKPLDAVAKNIPVLCVIKPSKGQDVWEDALKTHATGEVSAANNKITQDTIAKILFTSGSTGSPKGVINTHGNLLTNAQQTVQTLPVMADGIHLMDWLPWNHTFGGNNNFGMTLYTGGSLYIDDGNPSPQGILKTVENLKALAPTLYYNVPKGFEELIPHLRKDKSLCQHFFSRLKFFFYAGSNMPQRVWDDLEQLSYDTIGKRLFIGTGLGMTEASPSCMFNTKFESAPGKLGVPVPELIVKLVPDGDKLEARFKGKNLMPGYWRNAEATANAFDDEGFYKTGDAVKIIDENDTGKGLLFDGRIAENFKLLSGTWVNVGILRIQLIVAGDGLIQDAVMTGLDREYIGAILLLDITYGRKLTCHTDASINELVEHPLIREKIQNIIQELGKKSTGSSTLIQRAILADFELSIDQGELTDKGSINQRAILKNKSDYVDRLYDLVLNKEVIEYHI